MLFLQRVRVQSIVRNIITKIPSFHYSSKSFHAPFPDPDMPQTSTQTFFPPQTFYSIFFVVPNTCLTRCPLFSSLILHPKSGAWLWSKETPLSYSSVAYKGYCAILCLFLFRPITRPGGGLISGHEQGPLVRVLLGFPGKARLLFLVFAELVATNCLGGGEGW